MGDDELTAGQAAALTAAVDIDAPPPDGEPVALVLFGTNQPTPVRIAVERYRNGTAPLIIATGGINRHNGIIEGREFARQLADAGVAGSVVRVEYESKDTWQNVELSMPYLREALAAGLRLVAVSKWYHLRAVYCLLTQLPAAVPLYAIGWEPVYAGSLVTRDNWPASPDGRRRVIRESQEVPRRVVDGSYRTAIKKDGAWWLSLRDVAARECRDSPDSRARASLRCTGPTAARVVEVNLYAPPPTSTAIGARATLRGIRSTPRTGRP